MASDSRTPGSAHADDPLDVEGLAAIMQYTSEAPARTLYREMNGKCYNHDRALIRPFAKYIWLLMKALQVLEPFPSPMVFRGVKMDLSSEYPKDWSVSSCCLQLLFVPPLWDAAGSLRCLAIHQ